MTTHTAGNWELTVANATDACSGVYATRLEAVDAADDAASVSGLTARYGSYSAGMFVDADGIAWYSFRIVAIADGE